MRFGELCAHGPKLLQEWLAGLEIGSNLDGLRLGSIPELLGARFGRQTGPGGQGLPADRAPQHAHRS